MNKKRKTDVNGREGKRVRDPRRMKRRKIAKGEGGGEVGVVVVVVVVRGRKREREVEVRMKRERERGGGWMDGGSGARVRKAAFLRRK